MPGLYYQKIITTKARLKTMTEIKNALQKITFPNKQTVKTNILNVIFMSAIIGTFVCLADFVSVTAVDMLLNFF